MAHPQRLTALRATHLSAISSLYASTQPSISAYWGSELVDIRDAPEATLKPQSTEKVLCRACGSDQMQQRQVEQADGADIDAGSAPRPSPKNLGNRNAAEVSDSAPKCTVLTCLHCGQVTKMPAPEQKAKARPKGLMSMALPASVPVATTPSTITTDATSLDPSAGAREASVQTTEAKKAKRKQGKGGLAALLAKSKQSTGSPAASFGFADFAKR